METTLTTLLQGSRFAAAKVRFAENWDGKPFAQIEWSWKNEERAALVDFLRSAGFACQDRVASVVVWL